MMLIIPLIGIFFNFFICIGVMYIKFINLLTMIIFKDSHNRECILDRNTLNFIELEGKFKCSYT